MWVWVLGLKWAPAKGQHVPCLWGERVEQGFCRFWVEWGFCRLWVEWGFYRPGWTCGSHFYCLWSSFWSCLFCVSQDKTRNSKKYNSSRWWDGDCVPGNRLSSLYGVLFSYSIDVMPSCSIESSDIRSLGWHLSSTKLCDLGNLVNLLCVIRIPEVPAWDRASGVRWANACPSPLLCRWGSEALGGLVTCFKITQSGPAEFWSQSVCLPSPFLLVFDKLCMNLNIFDWLWTLGLLFEKSGA